jgi:hypothetical protein
MADKNPVRIKKPLPSFKRACTIGTRLTLAFLLLHNPVSFGAFLSFHLIHAVI